MITHAAPRPTASATNRWPSCRSPFKAMKTAPLLILVESVTISPNRFFPLSCVILPPVAARISALLHAIPRGLRAGSALELGASHLPIVEMNLLGTENLIILVPFAGDEHQVARRCGVDRDADRFSAIGLHNVPAPSLDLPGPKPETRNLKPL